MKLLLSLIFVGVASILNAEEVEPKEPPFEVGDLPLDSGYTIKRDGAPDLNFRIVDKKMKLYWLDDDGLIIAPEVSTAVVRFTGNTRGRDYFQLSSLSGDTGLGTSLNVFPPHRFNILLVLDFGGPDDVETFNFRYMPSMDAVASLPDA